MKPKLQKQPHPAPRSQMVKDVKAVLAMAQEEMSHRREIEEREDIDDEIITGWSADDESYDRIRPLLEAAPEMVQVLSDLSEAIDATGGLGRDKNGFYYPNCDPEWIDLGEIVNSAKAILAKAQPRSER